MFEAILFYTLAAFILGFAVLVVTARNTVHSVLFLVANFLCIAVLYIALAAELVAGRKCVLERWTRDGKYCGSGLARPTDAPQALGADGKEILRRVVFNQPPPDVKPAARKPAARREAK